jgi:plastocyanin
MKATTFFLMLFLAIQGLDAQTTYTVHQSGFTFDPAVLSIIAGDSVKFLGSASHPILQVSEATWNNNGTTALAGGFSFPSGSGKVRFPVAGTYYYVCTAHVATQGMKGKIIVATATALNNVAVSDKLSVFPVPLTGNELTVSLNTADQQKVFINIYDLGGNLRISSQSSSPDGRYLIDCSSLPKGLFLLKLKTDEGPYFAKIVKQ